MEFVCGIFECVFGETQFQHKATATAQASAKSTATARLIRPYKITTANQKQQQQQEQKHPAAASAATATDSKTYKQPVWQAAGLAGLLFEYFHIFLNIFEYFLISAL